MAKIEIDYAPRPLQLEAHNRRERFALLICHRRWGKTVFAINEMVRASAATKQKDVRCAYISPLYRQSKMVAWDMLKSFTRVIPDTTYNENELRCDLPNGARIQLFGGDSPDALRGAHWSLVVMDEYSQLPERLWPEIVRPALSDPGKEGRAIFIGTPQGHNAFYDLYQHVKNDDDWYVRIHRASETNYIAKEELEQAQKTMSPEAYAQEFECSFTAAVSGSYYGKLIEEAEADGRITDVPHDPAAPVETWWDLGFGDSTAIFWVQRINDAIHIIDYYEASGEPLAHYVEVLRENASGGRFEYSSHVMPHDVKQRSLDTGRSRVEAFRQMGLQCEILPIHRVEDGIDAVRRMLKKCWFDDLKTRRGVDCLRQYRAQYDDKRRTFRLRPVHDFASHAADAFRYGAMFNPWDYDWEPITYSNQGIV